MNPFIQVNEWLSTANSEKPDFEDIKKWLIEEIDELKEAINTNNTLEKYNAVADAIWILGNFIYYEKLSIGLLNQELEKVNLSNFTKFCKSEEEAIKTVEAYKNGTHPNKIGSFIDTYYVKNGNYFIIKRISDNKIMKSINFKDTDKIINIIKPLFVQKNEETRY